MATGKEIRDRVFAASGAILFFVTTIALTVVVIVQMVQDSKAKDAEVKSSQTTNANKPEGKKLEGFTPVTESVKEVQVTDLKVGEGKEVTAVENSVTAHYTGALASTGVIFQSSLDTGQPFTTKLTDVIKGWQTGMIGMKEGGERRIIIPAEDAYGPSAREGIPANSDLVFDIKLEKVE